MPRAAVEGQRGIQVSLTGWQELAPHLLSGRRQHIEPPLVDDDALADGVDGQRRVGEPAAALGRELQRGLAITGRQLFDLQATVMHVDAGLELAEWIGQARVFQSPLADLDASAEPPRPGL